MRKVVALACALWLLGAYALAQSQGVPEGKAQLLPLLQRQAELYERVAAATPDAAAKYCGGRKGVCSPGRMMRRGAACLNGRCGRGALPQAVQGGEDRETPVPAEVPVTQQPRVPERLDALGAQADALWERMAPLAQRLDEARARARLQAAGLSKADIDTYLSAHWQARALQAQADALYRGWSQADAAGRTAIEGEAAALNSQAEQALQGISALVEQVQAFESDCYYQSLAGLSSEEQAELRQLDERIAAYYTALYRSADSGRQ